jgi:hypothetical protein
MDDHHLSTIMNWNFFLLTIIISYPIDTDPKNIVSKEKLHNLGLM